MWDHRVYELIGFDPSESTVFPSLSSILSIAALLVAAMV